MNKPSNDLNSPGTEKSADDVSRHLAASHGAAPPGENAGETAELFLATATMAPAPPPRWGGACRRGTCVRGLTRRRWAGRGAETKRRTPQDAAAARSSASTGQEALLHRPIAFHTPLPVALRLYILPRRRPSRRPALARRPQL